jgi:uncharacterized membrane protein required for colicin V production
MNLVDAALIATLLACALRGWWRGCVRECFGLVALVAAVAAAFRLTAAGEALLDAHWPMSPMRTGVAFVAIFVLTHGLVNGTGALLDRGITSALIKGLSGVAGALLGTAKGAVALAFVLLFLHLFPVSGALKPQIMSSRIGRPLLAAASNAVRIGLQTGPLPSAQIRS